MKFLRKIWHLLFPPPSPMDLVAQQWRKWEQELLDLGPIGPGVCQAEGARYSLTWDGALLWIVDVDEGTRLLARAHCVAAQRAAAPLYPDLLLACIGSRNQVRYDETPAEVKLLASMQFVDILARANARMK